MNTTKQLQSLPQKILITGANGQLGRAFFQELGPERSIPVSRAEFDLTKPDACTEFLEKLRPSAILNAAAYTQVDLAEKETDFAFQSNSETPALLAQWCASHQIPFVHFSTDYVFSGEGTQRWKETDPTSPQNIYGKSKEQGEKKIQAMGGKYLIFRTSWVYDATGKNFLNTMLRLGQEKEHLRIIRDQIGAPTYAPDLARGSLRALDHALQCSTFPSGVYHLCGEGETNWYDFAQTIFELARSKNFPLKIKNVEPITSAEYPTPAKRPKNSRLDTTHFMNTFGFRLPYWKDSLMECMSLKA